MSIQILLENFLGLMKEDGELNKFLPILLSGMGHKIIFYADKGVREFGVDLVSVGKDQVDGKEKLFMWLIKCGNITRSAWNTQDQSVRQSIDEVGDVFLTTHVLPQHETMEKKLVVLTNGEYLNMRLTLAEYLKKWEARTGCDSEVVGGSALASWTERYLLDEHILPPGHQTMLRRVLANVANPELCVPVGRDLVRAIFESFNEPRTSVRAQLKVRLTAFRATRTALSVIFHWAQTEGSLESARQLSEFAILEAWVILQPVMIDDSKGNGELVIEFNELLLHYLTVGAAYSTKILPYLSVKNSLSLISGDALVTADLAFREIGQLGMQGTIWAFLSTRAGDRFSEVAAQTAHSAASAIIDTLNSHTCTRSPAFDYHALDIHVALLCLMVTGRGDAAATWLLEIVQRLDLISKFDANMRFWPMQADFSDALEARHDANYLLEEFLNSSMLLPIVLLWCASLGLAPLYEYLRSSILPRVRGTTMNMWFADENFDSIVNDPVALHSRGFSFTLSNLPADLQGFIALARKTSPEVPALETGEWYKAGCPFIPLLAARHWRLQIPKQMLVEHILAFSDHQDS